MPDWTRSMKQTYSFYIVDSGSWRDKERIKNVEKCTITRDSQSDTLGSATLEADSDYSDKYIRIYLETEQDKVKERTCLGTYLFQSPSMNYRATRRTSSQDGYTSLIELTENAPPYGYSLRKGDNILARAKMLVSEHGRAPVVESSSSDTLYDNFISNTSDTWLTFLNDLISNANYHFGLDPDGTILFERNQAIDALMPIWTFNDDNSSILHPDVSVARDLYGVPNAVEVIYSSTGLTPLIASFTNDDPNSLVSTVNRGRKVTYRETSPDVVEGINQRQLDEYAKNLLKEKSSLEYTLTYKHGYCPVRLGDCVMLNYKQAGLNNIKAKIIRQTINCESGCTVEETSVFSKQLWE